MPGSRFPLCLEVFTDKQQPTGTALLPSLSNGKHSATSPEPLATCQRTIFSQTLPRIDSDNSGFYVRLRQTQLAGRPGSGPGRLTAQEEVEFTLQVVEHLDRQLEAKAGETELRRSDSNEDALPGLPFRVDLRMDQLPNHTRANRQTHKLLTSFSPASSSCRFDICRLPGKRGFWKRQSGNG